MLRTLFIPASQFLINLDDNDRCELELDGTFEKRRYVGAFALYIFGAASGYRMLDVVSEGRLTDQDYPGNLESIAANAALFSISEDSELSVFEYSGTIQLYLPFPAGKFKGLYLMYKD